MKDDLNPMMQSRLEKWRKNTLAVKSAEKMTGEWHSRCRMVRGDYGDDIRDFQETKNKSLKGK